MQRCRPSGPQGHTGMWGRGSLPLHEDLEGNLQKLDTGLLPAQPRQATTFPGTQLSLSVEQGGTEAVSAQSLTCASSPKPVTLSSQLTPPASPGQAPSPQWGDWGPYAQPCLSFHLFPQKSWPEEHIPTFFIRLCWTFLLRQDRTPNSLANRWQKLWSQSSRCPSRYAKNN